jgi:hypothetical protein
MTKVGGAASGFVLVLLRSVGGWEYGLVFGFVLEFAEISHALGEGAQEGFAPSYGLELYCFLIQFDIGCGQEFHIARFWRGEFLYGDARLDFAAGMLFGDGVKVQLGESL